MHEQPKNRDWVKNAAIIFLAVLLVLTFFSNTIMNRSLPEVATQDVTSGSIVARVRGTGTVTANTNSQVKMEKTRVIRSVLVKVGQQVEPGDVLFTLGEGSSEDIDAAEEKLRSLQASYNRTAAGVPEYSYTTDNRKIENYRIEYEEALEKVADIERKIREEAEYQEKNADLLEALDRLAAAELLKNTAEEIYKSKIDEKAKALEEAKKNASSYPASEIEAKQNEITAAEAEQETYNGLVDSLATVTTDISSVESQIAELNRLLENYALSEQEKNEIQNNISQLQTQLSTLQAQLDEIEADEVKKQEIEAQITEVQNKITELEEQIANLDPNAAERAELERQIQELKNEQDRLSFNLQAIGMNDENKDEINSQYTAVTESIKEYEDKLANAVYTKEELETELANLQSTKTSLESNKTDIESTLATMQDPTSKIETLNAELSALLEQGASQSEIEKLMEELAAVSEEDLNNAVTYLAKCQAEVDALQAARTPKLNDDLKLAKESARYAEDNYRTAMETLDQKKVDNQHTLASYNADLADTWSQIEKAKEKLAELTGGEEAQILARTSGIVQSIECQPGDTKKKDDILCTLELPNMGYNLSFSVTNDQAARLRPGDTATVSNFYWGTEITATLNNIKVDPKNPQTNKLLTFDLSGNVTAGSELTLSVGQKSANYDIIIPSSAIRTDANGSFVLKVESKNSPLGNRYIARRVPVEVLASDDSNSAVSADLGFGDYVITTSSAPVKNGELVRLATS